jgi:hypothetical protein
MYVLSSRASGQLQSQHKDMQKQQYDNTGHNKKPPTKETIKTKKRISLGFQHTNKSSKNMSKFTNCICG